NLGFRADPSHDQGPDPLVHVRGKWPTTAREVVIDKATADHKHYAVGDSIGVQVHGPTEQFRISGLAELGGVASIGGATLAIFDLPTAQHTFRKVGRFDRVYVAAKPGTSTPTLLAEIRNVLPPSTEVRSGTAEAAKQARDTD